MAQAVKSDIVFVKLFCVGSWVVFLWALIQTGCISSRTELYALLNFLAIDSAQWFSSIEQLLAAA